MQDPYYQDDRLRTDQGSFCPLCGMPGVAAVVENAMPDGSTKREFEIRCPNGPQETWEDTKGGKR